MKKNKKTFILQAEGDFKLRQWHISFKKLWLILGGTLCLLVVTLFLTADSLTQYFYQSKLRKFQNNYSHLNTTLDQLNSQLIVLNEKMEDLEEQESELRKFSGLPTIDNDIREVGIGGVWLNESFEIPFAGNNLEANVLDLELNLDALSRKVNLELNSFNEIYEKVKENREKLEFIPSIRPVSEGYLNSGYGYRKDPFDGMRRFHHGQDFSVYQGADIVSPANGTVKRVGYRGGYGKYIILDHGYGYETKYLHLSKINVKKGQSVVRGELIGKTGNSGRSTAPHLHYEVIHNGTPQNPLNYFFTG